MFQLTGAEPPAGLVRRMTLVPFTDDGRCVLLETPGGPALPAGEVHDGEDYRDAVLRIPMQTAGFRYQRFAPFAVDGEHLYAWIEGGPYTGSRTGPPASGPATASTGSRPAGSALTTCTSCWMPCPWCGART
jgi:hypothetical protein